MLISTMIVGCGEKTASEITVYTAIEDEQISQYLRFFNEKYPDIKVNIVRDSTGIMTAKLLAEKENPQADVVWGLAATSLLVLDQEGLLEGYAPKGIEKVHPKFKASGSNPHWVGIDAWMTGNVIFNSSYKYTSSFYI